MDEKKLVMSNFITESRSYVDCLYSMLTTAGLYHMPKYMLSGMTGMLFKFIIHKRLLPSSLDMYSWQQENWQAVNILGIYNETYSGSPMDATFPLFQKQMLHKIIKSIDDSKAVIAWGNDRPRFCLYTGYNAVDQVLFYKDSSSEEDEVLLYDNFGLIDEGDWFIQIIGDRIEKDIRDIYRESLEIAIREWNTEYKVKQEYGSGRKAYQYLLEAFRNKNFNINGGYYFLETYINSKLDINRYMGVVVKEIPELSEAAGLYTKLSETIAPLKAVRLIGVPEVDMKYIPMAIEIFHEAMQLEDKAVAELEKQLNNYMHNKGVNPARLKEMY